MDAFRGQPGVNVEAVEPGTAHATLSGVRLSVLEYRYPLLRPLVDWPLYEACGLARMQARDTILGEGSVHPVIPGLIGCSGKPYGRCKVA